MADERTCITRAGAFLVIVGLWLGSGAARAAEPDPAGTTTTTTSAVRGADAVLEESPAPPRRSQELGATGDGTRRLLLVAGVALLIGAVIISFTTPADAGPLTNRERVRQRLGLTGGPHSATYSDPHSDDAPGA